MLTTEQPIISVVIPCRNEFNFIEICIQSLIEQTYPKEKIEIIVVDGISDDGTREKIQALQKHHSRLIIADNPQKRTPVALNIGARLASGEIIIILGAHTRVDKRFIELNTRYMREKDVKCVGGTQYNEGLTYWQKAIGLAMSSRWGIPSAPYRFSQTAGYVDTVVYAAYHRSLFDEIGYFDEELRISEDAEFNWRIRKAGYKIWFSPDIITWYYPRATLERFIRQFFNYGILRVNVIKKHPDAWKWIHLLPAILFLATGILAILAIFNSICFLSLLLVCLFYLIYLILASLFTGFKKKHYQFIPTLPLLFSSMQLSWVCGFLVGILNKNR